MERINSVAKSRCLSPCIFASAPLSNRVLILKPLAEFLFDFGIKVASMDE